MERNGGKTETKETKGAVCRGGKGGVLGSRKDTPLAQKKTYYE